MKYFLILTIFFLLNAGLNAWEDCPYNIVDCTGLCGSFVDKNEDGLCDHSQPQPESLNLTGDAGTVDESTQISTSENVEDSLSQDLIEVTEVDESDAASEWLWIKKSKYHLIPITIILTCLYLISRLLCKKSILSSSAHKKIWNFLLFIFFIICSLSSIFLIVQINFQLVLNLPFNLLFIHVESGIAMMIISIFHITWHGSYIKKFLKK
ncbi:MAG: hypothetical protein ACP5FK_08325 [bacterium]